MRKSLGSAGLLLVALGSGSCGSEPDEAFTEFIVAVGEESFVVRASDPETIRLGYENLRGGLSVFPIGPLRAGDGGFNTPWSWHLDPDRVRFTEVAIEVCDGAPSYVEEHVDEYTQIGYCPWGGRVVGVRP